MGNILIVDDEPHMRRILLSNLQQDKHQVTAAAGVEEARQLLAANQYDTLITDQKMPDGSGLDVLTAVREADPALSVIFLTAAATLELAVESMRQGAFDFLAKPFTPEVLRATAARACDHTVLLRENNFLKGAIGRLQGRSEIFGSSPAIEEVRQKITRVAATNATVLITGETGTGKELVARSIHQMSPRAARPFIAINCAAVSETLLESELFGHERGAFTGADRARQGLFEAAHEGTLFLDEVGEMSASAQAKLLRVLTDGQVLRVGSTKPRKVDVRVLVATHRDLQQRVREGLFREDLYYRVAVVPIALPALRERREDIGGLAEIFVAQASAELKQPRRRLSAAALERLQQYDFPGNIRELHNLIERACILSAGSEIGPEQFPVNPASSEASPVAGPSRWLDSLPEEVELRPVLADMEKKLIERALRSTHGAQAEAARKLGLSRSDLAYKLSKYDIKVPAAAGA